MVRPDATLLINKLLDAAETVVERQGIANLTLDAVALEAGLSKGGLLYHFPSKDRLVEALVARSARGWRQCFSEGYERAEPGPGRQSRALLNHCLSDAAGWTRELRRSSSACFAALAQNPSLMQPMREVYAELHRRVADDGLPPGVGEAVAAAIDGLWLYWVLGLAEVNQDLVVRVRGALEDLLKRSLPAEQAANATVSADGSNRAIDGAGATASASAAASATATRTAAAAAKTPPRPSARRSASTASAATSNVVADVSASHGAAKAVRNARPAAAGSKPAATESAAAQNAKSATAATRSAAAAKATQPAARRAAAKAGAARPKKGLRP
ncbi:TetR/AcrR family transcriptional regulator [Tahibacter harae]|uniref:TetR/AcrR family transcriptional regulator n=1 Tax=Tahibacter harae TaxID=2963937 RepID=A0ABT1QTE3_9GAMM|nr:TetR/AcrR family transcriptional regulator [Tahibacter harae]MCQ4165555.1 TetR/AcrR family transcriptional regulator [Tahibacter harae]